MVAKRFPLHGQCLGVEHKLVEFDAESVGLHGPKSQPEQVKAEQLAGQLGAAAAGLLELLEWLGLVAGLAAHGRAKLFGLAGWALGWPAAVVAELFALAAWALPGLVAGRCRAWWLDLLLMRLVGQSFLLWLAGRCRAWWLDLLLMRLAGQSFLLWGGRCRAC